MAVPELAMQCPWEAIHLYLGILPGGVHPCLPAPAHCIVPACPWWGPLCARVGRQCHHPHRLSNHHRGVLRSACLPLHSSEPALPTNTSRGACQLWHMCCGGGVWWRASQRPAAGDRQGRVCGVGTWHEPALGIEPMPHTLPTHERQRVAPPVGEAGIFVFYCQDKQRYVRKRKLAAIMARIIPSTANN